ncbi:hypothetical protein ISF_01771 [Cordyceps fumosorosea ARSEF 2679]|uniref:Uncharacterized protein n=1 Tax=Cordyceps fumosorosea (strain ARSEF 2679) TaxID=1081104 RepID=A0A168CCE6_CORFA|nr:hypothetical protein ISF_01771 [Cordyceps fumosorosea ARSEF 2679]OAA71220.1 hypothetical protein ISF_01771 [Cordyceps fumosorosea ARSEF 2679]
MASLAFYCARDKPPPPDRPEPHPKDWDLEHFCILRHPVEGSDLQIGKVVGDPEDDLAPLSKVRGNIFSHVPSPDRTVEHRRTVHLGPAPATSARTNCALPRTPINSPATAVEDSIALKKHLANGDHAFLVTGVVRAAARNEVSGSEGPLNTDKVTTATPGQAVAESLELRSLDGKLFAVRLVQMWYGKGVLGGFKVRSDRYIVGE